MKLVTRLVTLLLTCCATVSSQTLPKRVYIAADDHTDYMWSGDEAAYQKAFLEMIDYYLNLADATTGNPSDIQSRWNCDGSFWVWTYEKNRPGADFNRLIDRIRDGHISVPLTVLASCYGGMPTEAVLRGMYYAGSIERRYQLRFPLAIAMENQTLPYGLGALWAGAGARYSWRGICGCASRLPSAADREHEIYWWIGPDDSRILMKWNSMPGKNDSIGGYAESRNPSEVIDDVTVNARANGFLQRYPYDIVGLFGKGWDDLKTLTGEFPEVARRKSDSSRRILVSNEQDFFEDFERTYGDHLPSLSASFGNEWDLYCASLAEVSARVKRAVENLRAAEALATLVSLQDTSFMERRTKARDLAWIDLGLYWEHDWTADGTIISKAQRAAWQRKIAVEIEAYVNQLQSDAAKALGGMIQKQRPALCFYAFNPLGWTRSDIADLPYSEMDRVHVVDLSTGEETPVQIVISEGQNYLRVLARDIPPVGYKVFEVLPGRGRRFSNAASISKNVLENAFYRIKTAERGAITSLIDKKHGRREFVRTIDGRAINDLGPSEGKSRVENAGPVSVTLRAEALHPLQHVTRITLIRDNPRIEIRNEIRQSFSDTVTWSYAFAINSPDIWHEELGAVIRGRLLSNGGNYSPRNARYDWLTLNHFVDINEAGLGVTLSNADCFFMKLGHSTLDTLDVNSPLILPLVGGQVDGAELGIPNQGGDQNFLQRFALQTHDDYDPIAAMRFALEHQNPLITGVVTGGSAYPAERYSFASISNPQVLLWALKPAEEGIDKGVIARVWNLSPHSADFALKLARTLSGAKRTTHVETDLENATVREGALMTSVARQQLRTYRLMTKGE